VDQEHGVMARRVDGLEDAWTKARGDRSRSHGDSSDASMTVGSPRSYHFRDVAGVTTHLERLPGGMNRSSHITRQAAEHRVEALLRVAKALTGLSAFPPDSARGAGRLCQPGGERCRPPSPSGALIELLLDERPREHERQRTTRPPGPVDARHATGSS
jgi:hypothetical protein